MSAQGRPLNKFLDIQKLSSMPIRKLATLFRSGCTHRCEIYSVLSMKAAMASRILPVTKNPPCCFGVEPYAFFPFIESDEFIDEREYGRQVDTKYHSIVVY